MENLNILRINSQSPYSVSFDGTSYLFFTDSGACISISFSPLKSIDSLKGFWLSLDNQNGFPSFNDQNLRKTVFCVMEDFFLSNYDYLLFMCEFDDGKQAIRNRMFKQWFNSYDFREKFSFMNRETKYEGNITYISLIASKSNPMSKYMTDFFNEAIDIFNRNKP